MVGNIKRVIVFPRPKRKGEKKSVRYNLSSTQKRRRQLDKPLPLSPPPPALSRNGAFMCLFFSQIQLIFAFSLFPEP